MKIKNKIFLDLEANCPDNKKNRSKSELLQLSAIKVDENNEIIETFNQYCFNEKINQRIANLLNKDIYFFNNKDFKKVKEIYLEFLKFSQNCEIFTFSNFDQFIFEIIHRKKFKKNKNIPLIKLNDIQVKLTKKIECNKNSSLNTSTKILNIKQNDNSHDSLEDAKTLFEIYKIVNNVNFNKNDYLERKENIKFLPTLTSREWVDRNTNSKNYPLSTKQKIVLAFWKEKMIEKDLISKSEIEDVHISNILLDQIKKEIETYISINFYEIDNEMNVIKKLKINKTVNKEKVDENHYININELENFLWINRDAIFLTNSKKFIIPFSKKFNCQFWNLNYQLFPNKLDENDVINGTNKFTSIIYKIKKAIIFFKQ